MCKYCTCNKNLYGKGFPIADGYYETCFIQEEDNYYYIVVVGSDKSYSEPISFCPFCSRNLKK